MTRPEIRAQAREALSGNWGKAAIISLLFMILTAVLFSIPVIQMLAIVVLVPVEMGLYATYISLANKKDVDAFDFITYAKNNFGRSWSVFFAMLARIIGPFLLYILGAILMGVLPVVGASISESMAAIFAILGFAAYFATLINFVIKSLRYALAYFIAIDEPNTLPKDCVEKSYKLMEHNVLNYFILSLSFIGWMILASFTFGIGYLWLMPYMMISEYFFYKSLKGDTLESTIVKEEPVTEEVFTETAEPVVEENVNPIQQ